MKENVHHRDENLYYLDKDFGVRSSAATFRAEGLALDRINQKIAGGQTLDQVMNLLFESLQDACPCDRIGLAFLSDDGERLEGHWVRANYKPILLGVGYAEDLRGSSLRNVIEDGTPRIINDLRKYMDAHPASAATRLLVREGVRSSVTCPLAVDGRIVGVLFQSSRAPDQYDEHHVQMHLSIVERLSQAVEKAYRIEQLSAANNAYKEVLGFVSHEIKGPLASMLMNIEILKREYVGKLNTDQIERVDALFRQGNYLARLVQEYLDLSRMEGGELKSRVLRNVDFVASVLKPVEELLRTDINERGMKLITNLPEMELRCDCDPDLMKIVVVNLVNNATKYGKENGEIRVTAAKDNENLVVSVWNEGPGFGESDKAALFKKFSRLESPEFARIKGTGLGLYTSWLIVKQHEGRISADSKLGEWAEFTFDIPIRNVTSHPSPKD